MLKLTGHPLVDVGIHVITAYANKTDPATVTVEDLDAIADYLEPLYSEVETMKNFAWGVIFPSAGFGQPAYSQPRFLHRRKAYADLMLRGHRHLDLKPRLAAFEDKKYDDLVLRDQPDAPPCVFTGEEAYFRADRAMIPLLNGREVINFGAQGTTGLPVSDIALLAIHAMPLGCVISQGRLLAVESSDPKLAFEFARQNLETNLKYFAMTSLEGVPNFSSFRTRLIEELVDIQYAPVDVEFSAPSLTAYHFTNSGQDAKIDIYPLPSQVVSFLFHARKGEYQDAWQRIVASASYTEKSEEVELQAAKPKITRRNFVYEDLFDLPENALKFLRTYLLRRPMKLFRQDPRESYNTMHEIELISWDLTDLFMRRMLNVKQERLNKLRELGDSLAAYIVAGNESRLLRDMYYERKPEKFRSVLLRAAFRATSQQPANAEPLIPYDTYIKVFEEEDEDGERPNWLLACDLLLIRIFEQLHRAGWLKANADVLQEAEQATEAEAKA